MRHEVLPVNGIPLALHRLGSGRPLLAVHGGLGLDSASLRVPAVLGLAGPDREVVVPDLRGHGGSGRSDPASYTHAQWVEDLRALADVLGDGPVDLLGHSYGGFLALEFALRYPQRLRRLVLIGTSPGPVAVAAPSPRTDAELGAWFREAWPSLFAGRDAHWEVLDACTFSVGPFLAAFHREIGAYDVRERVGALQAPTLLLVGSEDRYRRDMEWLAGRMPAARLVVMPGVGHLPFLEAPAAFTARVREFLE